MTREERRRLFYQVTDVANLPCWVPAGYRFLGKRMITSRDVKLPSAEAALLVRKKEDVVSALRHVGSLGAEMRRADALPESAMQPYEFSEYRQIIDGVYSGRPPFAWLESASGPCRGTGVGHHGASPLKEVVARVRRNSLRPLDVSQRVLKGSYLRMNVDVGRQSNGGKHAVLLGNIANSRSCEQSRRWERKSFLGRSVPEPVTAHANGRIWLLFGVDSGFEDSTEVYFTGATAVFTPI